MALVDLARLLRAAWAISLSPGPGAIAVVRRVEPGFARGCFATFGLILGFWTQLVVVAVGLGAVIATSALAFAVVKWLGVAYLVYLGIRQWRAAPLALPTSGRVGTADAAPAIVVEAWLLNAVNPKGTVFMLAVVPQFLTAGRAAPAAVPRHRRDARVHRPGRQPPLRGARRARARRAANGGTTACHQSRLRQPVRRASASCSRPSSAPEGRVASAATLHSTTLARPALTWARTLLPSSRRSLRGARRPRRLARAAAPRRRARPAR